MKDKSRPDESMMELRDCGSNRTLREQREQTRATSRIEKLPPTLIIFCLTLLEISKLDHAECDSNPFSH